MKERLLGRTGLTVKTLGFGGIPIQRVSEEDAIHVVRRCYELGINYFDTARNYTVSEERIGRALEDVREEVYLTTKSSRRSREGVLEELEVSLTNLRTSWIDVYQLHNVSSREAWEQVKASHGALDALYEARDMGKIRHIGVTSHDPSLLTEIVAEDIFETVMIPFNYLTSLPADELLPVCHEVKVGTVIMKPFGGGALSNATLALKFLLGDEHVDVVIPGMLSVAEVEENIAVASGIYTLTDAELDLIEKNREALGDQFCRACDYCQPCPQEIPISRLLRWETVEKRMGWSPRFETRFREGVAKASTCIDCGECESRCPYHLPIRELLAIKTATLKEQYFR
ncbi:MAG: aldo/keto reductase [Candidatus Bathyarchaeota archaeon]|nr:aldo/keto reductase [Candidatus Bathyarchaeota archaeon]